MIPDRKADGSGGVDASPQHALQGRLELLEGEQLRENGHPQLAQPAFGGRRRGSAAPVHTMMGSDSQLRVGSHLLDHPQPEVLLVGTLEINDQRLRPRLANGLPPRNFAATFATGS